MSSRLDLLSIPYSTYVILGRSAGGENAAKHRQLRPWARIPIDLTLMAWIANIDKIWSALETIVYESVR